jgi:hypothetical protein
MKQFLCSLLCLFAIQMDPVAHFKNFTKSGTEKYCMVNYKDKTISCTYKTMEDCHNDYTNHPISVCFSRKSLKLGDGVETGEDEE